MCESINREREEAREAETNRENAHTFGMFSRLCARLWVFVSCINISLQVLKWLCGVLYLEESWLNPLSPHSCGWLSLSPSLLLLSLSFHLSSFSSFCLTNRLFLTVSLSLSLFVCLSVSLSYILCTVNKNLWHSLSFLSSLMLTLFTGLQSMYSASREGRLLWSRFRWTADSLGILLYLVGL